MADRESSPTSLSLPELLQDWDGQELMVGVQIAAKARGVKTLQEWLELTTEVEAYQHHLHRKSDD